jgi:uncharacterized membrane protein
MSGVGLGARLDSLLGRKIIGGIDWGLALLLAAALAYFVVFSWLSVLRYEALQSSIDLGSQTQVLYGIVHGWVPAWTELQNYFDVFAYSAAGLQYFVPGPKSLLVYQTALIDIAVIPLYFLSLKAINRRWIALLISGSYLLNPLTQALNWFDVHFEFCAIPFVFGFLYFHASKKQVPAVACLVLALSFSYLVAAGLAAWCVADTLREWWVNSNPRFGAQALRSVLSGRYRQAILGASIGWLILSFLITSHINSATNSAGISNFINSDWPGTGSTFTGVVLAPFLHSRSFITNLTYQGDLKVWFLVVVFGAFLFLPLLDIRAVFAMVPWLFLALSSQNSDWYSLTYYQYGGLLLPFLYPGFIQGSLLARKKLKYDYVPIFLGALVLLPAALIPTTGWRGVSGIFVLLLAAPVLAVLAITNVDVTNALLNWRPWQTGPANGTTLLGPESKSSASAATGAGMRLYSYPRNDWKSSKGRPRYAVWLCFAFITFILFALYTPFGPFSSIATDYRTPVISDRDSVANEIILTIPPNASVLAQDHLYPSLWNYRYATLRPPGSEPANYIFADIGDNGISIWDGLPWDYYHPVEPSYPALSTMVMQNLSLGLYGVSAESDGFVLMERGFSGPPQMYSPYDGQVNPCSLDYFPTSGETCSGTQLTQTSNPSGQGTLWYGPYVTLPPGNFTAIFNLEVNRSLPENVLTLGVTSYLTSQIPNLQTLAEKKINGTSLGAPGGGSVTVNFTVEYPSYIQFVATSEVPNVLVTLNSLSWIQVSPPETPALSKIVPLLNRSATILVQRNLEPSVEAYLPFANETLPSSQFTLVDLNSAFYSSQILTNGETLASFVANQLSNHTAGVLAESGGYMLIERGYSGPPRIFSPYNGVVSPCSLYYFSTSGFACQGGRLSQESNSAGQGTLWYGPYVTLPAGNFSVFENLSANRSLSSNVVTLAVTSYLTSRTPQLETLTEIDVNSTLMARSEGENVEINFTLEYPSSIQFVAEFEVPNILLSLNSLSWTQTSG